MARMTSVLAAAVLAGLVPPLAQAQSNHPGLGAIPYPGGTAFRTWAPHAEAISVIGDFNGWNPEASPLAREAGGWWSADVPGASVGDRFRYVIRRGDVMQTRREPRSRVVTDSDFVHGDSIIYDPRAFAWTGPPFTPPDRRDLVIYELHVGTFHTRSGAVYGDFAGAIEQLPHIAALGATAVELVPVTEFFQTQAYGPTDPYAVENLAYGGPDGLKELVQASHANGLAVILDVVHNHWAVWDLAVHTFDGWSTPQWPGGIFLYDQARIDSPFGPRPNYDSREVQRYIRDSFLMWVDEYRVDGFRWDSTANIYDTDSGHGAPLPRGATLIRSINNLLHARYPGLISIAEDLTGSDFVSAPASAGGLGYDAQWHYFASTLRAALKAPNDGGRNLAQVATALRDDFNGDPWQRVIYTESHNEVCCGLQRLTRLIDAKDPDSYAARKRSTLGAAVLLTSPGIPLVYQGQEFLEQTAYDEQTPMDWTQLERQPGIFQLYADITRLRLDRDGRTAGLRGDGLDVYHVNDFGKLMAYHRWDAGGPHDDVTVIANFSQQRYDGYLVGMPRPGTWVARFNSDDPRYSPDYEGFGSATVEANLGPLHGQAQSARVSVAPYSVLVLSQE
jgi:1,4-alpha-glucan branching enzyme